MPSERSACQPLAEPKRLPEPSLVLDTAALFARLDSLAAVSPNEVAVSLLWSDQAEGYLFGEIPPLPWHQIVLEHILASLRPAPHHASLAVQVHLQLGPNRRIWLEPAILCAPQVVEGQNVDPPPGVGMKTFAPSPIPGYQPQRIRSKTLINASGAVTTVTILTSSGYPELDRDVVRSTKAQHYRPALLDGRPVAVWISDSGIRLAA